MLVKNHLIVFPWSPAFKSLSVCPNVKRGNFRIGQLLFETKFRKSFIIIAKSYSLPIFDTEAIVSNLNRKIAEADKNYLDGLTCPHDYLVQIHDAVLSSYEDLTLSNCRLHCDICPNVCPSKPK